MTWGSCYEWMMTIRAQQTSIHHQRTQRYVLKYRFKRYPHSRRHFASECYFDAVLWSDERVVKNTLHLSFTPRSEYPHLIGRVGTT